MTTQLTKTPEIVSSENLSNESEISDNESHNNQYLLAKMIDAYANDQFENQEENIGCNKESMLAALKAIRPYLQPMKPVSVSLGSIFNAFQNADGPIREKFKKALDVAEVKYVP